MGQRLRERYRAIEIRPADNESERSMRERTVADRVEREWSGGGVEEARQKGVVRR